MIIDETTVGRYIFIFDIRDATPFRGLSAISHPLMDCTKNWFIDSIPTSGNMSIIEPFIPMEKWLRDITPAFRMQIVLMKHTIYNDISAVAVHCPVDLAVLFRMFWYDS